MTSLKNSQPPGAPKKITQKLKVGVVGATGMVGQTFMKLLEERSFPIEELRPFASSASLGKTISLGDRSWPVRVLEAGCFDGLDLVFFSSGDEISRDWAPQALKSGAFAIDNSAAFRMSSECHLIVPEVNGHLVNSQSRPQIIANPNCSTIQLVVALKPLDRAFGIKEIKVASYQAVSGAGQAGTDELLNQMATCPVEELKVNLASKTSLGEALAHQPNPQAFPHPILFNVIPQIGSFNEEGFCTEELKIQRETKKILFRPDLKISAFTVRVPALNTHSEAVWVTLNKRVDREDILKAFSEAPGIVVQDYPEKSIYPTAREVSGKDPVYVGRIHCDPEEPSTWLLWVVSDNVRKGAALNGIQIAEDIFSSR
jgi:aspartate-semialdehyde dehydrogenase